MVLIKSLPKGNKKKSVKPKRTVNDLAVIVHDLQLAHLQLFKRVTHLEDTNNALRKTAMVQKLKYEGLDL